MRKRHFFLSVWPILVISLPIISCSGWRPIAPPDEYYAIKAKKCISDCDAEYKTPSLASGGEGLAEVQLKSTLLSQPPGFSQDQDSRKSETNLNLDVYAPTEVAFFPSGAAKKFDPPASSYQEVLRKSPGSFYSFKTYSSPPKSVKTLYYGDVEVAKPKFSPDVKYYKPYKPNPGTEVKIFNPGAFLGNEVSGYRPSKGSHFNDHCSLHKVSFRQDLYYQYIQYKVHMPELKEFTLCLWTRFHNHSHDHSLFSYAAKHHRQAIYMWVSNLNEPGLFNMKVMGQTIFRLNYPIKLYKWYHTCQSWNGNTGEWQVWVNSHRIARGFHNLLVGHPIPGGGLALSGQEQRHFGKGFQEIPHYLKGSGGLEGEVTMLQMYKVALTAGKAYNDHSHHHSHYTSTTTEPPELPTEEPSTTTVHPFLENGQLKKHINVLELAEALRQKGHLDVPEHHSPLPLFGQPYVGHVAPVAVHGNAINFLGLPSHAVFKRNDESEPEGNRTREDAEPPEKVKFVNNVLGQIRVEKITFSGTKDEARNVTLEDSGENVTEPYGDSEEKEQEEEKTKTSGFRVGRKRLRRHNGQTSPRMTASRPKRIAAGELKPARYLIYRPKKRGEPGKPVFGSERQDASKRHIFFEDPYLNFGAVGLVSHEGYYGGIPSSDLSHEAFPHLGQDYPDLHEGGDQNQDDSPPPHDSETKKEVELAEGEVRRVMELCSGCYLDPFRKVAVISWRSTPKKIYSGALFLKARSECENF